MQDQSVPQTQRPIQKLPMYKQLAIPEESSSDSRAMMSATAAGHVSSERYGSVTHNDIDDDVAAHDNETQALVSGLPGLVESFAGRDSKERAKKDPRVPAVHKESKFPLKDKQRSVRDIGREKSPSTSTNEYEFIYENEQSDTMLKVASKPVEDFNQRIAEQQADFNPCSSTAHQFPNEIAQSQEQDKAAEEKQSPEVPSHGVVQNAFDRMRPRRDPPETAIITIGSKTMTTVLASTPSSEWHKAPISPVTPIRSKSLTNDSARQKFGSSMKSFAAPGSQLIKTINRPQSKSRVSVEYVEDGDSDEAVYVRTSGTESPEFDEEEVEEGKEGQIPEDASTTSDVDQADSPENGFDGEYLDEELTKAEEDARVVELISKAEAMSAMPHQYHAKRAHQMLKGAHRKDLTTNLIQVIDASVNRITKQINNLERALHNLGRPSSEPKTEYQDLVDETSAEERLSLTVSKTDFANMQVTGQFNLGFILANRSNTDLFIIDQHASDEKYNFERLQSTTMVQNQRLVQPRTLQLTAMEEEIVLENNDALLRNGFLVDVDESGDLPVGQRCKLLSLPMSREVTFDATDLEELITLLADSPTSSSAEYIPRPSKVRRMFAMRACRSSIMIGKTLTPKQMGVLVRHMGEIDKPWNCPHGRPTMRHVCGLEGWNSWEEGDGLSGMEEEIVNVDWGVWLEGRKEALDGEQDDNEGGDEEFSEREEEEVIEEEVDEKADLQV